MILESLSADSEISVNIRVTRIFREFHLKIAQYLYYTYLHSITGLWI